MANYSIVLPLLLLITLAIITHQAVAKSCETEDYEVGTCVSIQKCEKIVKIMSEGLSPGLQRLVEREQEKCVDAGEDRLICCERNRRQEIPVFREDVKPIAQGMHDFLANASICGIDSLNRNDNGNRTYPDQFRWSALIMYVGADDNEYFDCGGSLINPRYVLTAGHCVKTNIVGVRLGEWDLTTNPDCEKHQEQQQKQCATPVVEIGIEKIIQHKQFKHSWFKPNNTDLALLRLDHEVTYSQYIMPICLPRSEKEGRMFVTGWGKTATGERNTRKKFGEVSNVPLDECRKAFKAPLIKFHNAMICALGVNGKDSCLVDSGGPLMEIQKEDNGAERYFLKGVFSASTTCTKADKPAFFIDVYKNIDWIVSNMEA